MNCAQHIIINNRKMYPGRRLGSISTMPCQSGGGDSTRWLSVPLRCVVYTCASVQSEDRRATVWGANCVGHSWKNIFTARLFPRLQRRPTHCEFSMRRNRNATDQFAPLETTNGHWLPLTIAQLAKTEHSWSTAFTISVTTLELADLLIHWFIHLFKSVKRQQALDQRQLHQKA